ncbi:MAG: DNA photolyase [Acidobacteriota bacterium]|nr:DNA photolyase [Acidobacteriota bacterium]
MLVHEDSLRDAATGEILSRLSGVETKIVRNHSDEAEAHSKDTLFLTRHKGKFLKPCQGGGAEMCCNYYIAGYAWNCRFDCSYCVLQGYLTNPALIVATNIEDYMDEIGGALRALPNRVFRIGTGELADSLALDAITRYTKRVVPFFAALPNGVLELKTKSVEIANLEGLNHGGHTVVSWSLNSKKIRASEEKLSATIDGRLAAAAQCAKWGYRLGFHFDPLVYYPGWEEDYREIVRELFSVINPENIAWISLGALRFTPRLGEAIRRRHPESRLPYGEFVPGHHGKLRYFRPLREEMYRKMFDWIRNESRSVFVYLCMESRLVWERCLSDGTRDKEHLSDMLDSRVLQNP